MASSWLLVLEGQLTLNQKPVHCLPPPVAVAVRPGLPIPVGVRSILRSALRRPPGPPSPFPGQGASPPPVCHPEPWRRIPAAVRFPGLVDRSGQGRPLGFLALLGMTIIKVFVIPVGHEVPTGLPTPVAGSACPRLPLGTHPVRRAAPSRLPRSPDPGPAQRAVLSSPRRMGIIPNNKGKKPWLSHPNS